MSEDEYRDLVLTDLDRQVKVGLLPELTASTRSSIKAKCVSVCTERYDQKDEPLLRSFFGKKEGQAAYLMAIRNVSAEEFRTLNNFLNDRTIQTAFKNIRLLAWLIGFEPRPYHYELELPPTLQEPVIAEFGDQRITDLPPEQHDVAINHGVQVVIEAEAKKGLKWQKVLWAVGLVIMLAGGTAYWFSQGVPPAEGAEPAKPRVVATRVNDKCMYWNTDHFETIAYRFLPAGKTAYQLDSTDAVQFKRIMQPETLHISDTGHVWYFKMSKDSIEYFTAAGFHPVLANRRLKPLTGYMYDKYLKKLLRKTAGQ